MALPNIHTEQHYTAAVTTAVADLLHNYRGYQIDILRPLPNYEDDSRSYQLWITAWDQNEDKYEFIHELQIGAIQNELIVLSWMPL